MPEGSSPRAETKTRAAGRARARSPALPAARHAEGTAGLSGVLDMLMTLREAILKRATKWRAKAAKRELIAPRGDKRYIRRDAKGRIEESDDVSRSLSQDRRKKAKTPAKAGQGDRGDRKPAKAKASKSRTVTKTKATKTAKKARARK